MEPVPGISLFIVDPRLLLELLPYLRRFRIRFRIPRGLDDLCLEDEVLLIDPDGFNYVAKAREVEWRCGKVVLAGNIEEALRAIIHGVLREPTPISIGIDLGKKMAFAVLSGHKLLLYDYADSVESIKKLIERLSYPYDRIIIVGIGAGYLKELPSELLDLLYDERVAAAYIVEEEGSNEAFSSNLVDTEAENLPRDIRAAIFIAMRTYERYFTLNRYLKSSSKILASIR